MNPVCHLTPAALRAIHAEVIAVHGGAPGVRDEALLESAVAAPQATMSGRPLLTDPVEIAAAYLFYLCRDHPFADGNKRTALAACLVFLEANGMLASQRLATDDWEALCLIHQAHYLLDRQIERLDREFVEQGGLTERMHRVRSQFRKTNPPRN